MKPINQNVLNGILSTTNGKRVMTRAEVAAYLGVTTRTVARIFSGKLVAVERLAEYLS